MSFRRQPDLVSVVRRFVLDFYGSALGDPELTSRVALATHELLENAVKYSRDGEASVRIQLRGKAPHVRVRIQTRNRASEADAELVRQTLTELSASDPNVYYFDLMRKNANRKSGSGLGLARIQAEAEMSMSASRGRNGTLTVSAEAEVPLRRHEGAA